MENFLYFAEAVVETGGDLSSEALCIPASSYVSADPVGATTTAFYFRGGLSSDQAVHKVVLTHGSNNNKAVIKGVLQCVNAAPHSSGLVVVADAETGTAVNKAANFSPVFGGDVTAVAITQDVHGFDQAVVGTTVSTSYGAGMTSTEHAPRIYQYQERGVIITKCLIDLTGLANKNDEDDVIGLAAGGAAYFFKNVTSENGVIFKIEMTCLELPTASSNVGLDVDLRANSSATVEYDGDGSGFTSVIAAGADMVLGDTLRSDADHGAANDYYYLTTGSTHTGDSTYTAGKLMITFYGHKAYIT
tara:strand:- start:442 stop:1350 length:909 start_codon:yes stop_codon:yes gene_type:complete